MRRGNGEGSIFMLSGKRRKPYAVRVTVGWTEEGKQKYKYIGYYEGIREAKKALREYLVKPYNLESKDTTMKELFNDWTSSADIAPQTLRSYGSAFNQCKELHNRKIRQLKIFELEEAMYKLKPSVQANFRNAMRQLYRHAIKHDIIDKDLSTFLKPQQTTMKQRKPFTLEQIEKIRTFNHKYNDITIILLYTGLRINELLRIKKEDVHLDQRYMIGGIKTKAGINRVIPIHDNIFDLVEKYYNNSSKYLIENKNKPIAYRTFMTVYWERLKEYLQTDQTPHCTRHTFITQADALGLNRTILKKIVGHCAGDITDHYTYKYIKELTDEVNKLKY